MIEHATKGLVPSHPSAPRGPSHARSQLALARAPPSNFARRAPAAALARARRPREPPRGGCAAPLAPAANAAPTFCCTASAVCRRAAARALRTTRTKAGAADARGPARPLASRRAALAAARCSVRAVTAASVAVMAPRRASAVVAVRASSTARRFRERAAGPFRRTHALARAAAVAAGVGSSALARRCRR